MGFMLESVVLAQAIAPTLWVSSVSSNSTVLHINFFSRQGIDSRPILGVNFTRQILA